MRQTLQEEVWTYIDLGKILSLETSLQRSNPSRSHSWDRYCWREKSVRGNIIVQSKRSILNNTNDNNQHGTWINNRQKGLILYFRCSHRWNTHNKNDVGVPKLVTDLSIIQESFIDHLLLKVTRQSMYWSPLPSLHVCFQVLIIVFLPSYEGTIIR